MRGRDCLCRKMSLDSFYIVLVSLISVYLLLSVAVSHAFVAFVGQETRQNFVATFLVSSSCASSPVPSALSLLPPASFQVTFFVRFVVCWLHWLLACDTPHPASLAI